MTAPVYADAVFAPIDRDLRMERIAGGNETEVYRTDDRRYVVKLKGDLGLGNDVAAAVACARSMSAAAAAFAACLGPRASIPSFAVVARDQAGQVQVLVLQPFLDGACPLHDLEYGALAAEQRAEIATQLREIIRRALTFYRDTGSMPDLYGRSSSSHAERARLNAPWMLPWRLWSFLVGRNLLRSHNLLRAPDGRIVLVDYDVVRRGWLYRLVYYAVRWLLFWRDHALILVLRAGGAVPRGQ